MFYLALIGLKFFGWFLSLLPRKVFLRLGQALGLLLLKVGFRREVADDNTALAFRFMDPSQRARFLSDNYREMGVLFLELLGSFYKFDRFVEKNCDVENEEYLRKALAGGKGIFVMSAHLGNWEVLTTAGPEIFSVPVTMVTKELKPVWLHRAVAVTRELMGVKMAVEPRTMPNILRALKKGEIVGFMVDQYAGAPVGARVPFFGKAVGTHTALAALAIRTGAVVLPAIAVRQPNGRYLIRFDPPFETLEGSDLEDSVLKNTAQYARHTENWIKEFPLQWLWIHRRWKGDLSPLPTGAVGEMLK